MFQVNKIVWSLFFTLAWIIPGQAHEVNVTPEAASDFSDVSYSGRSLTSSGDDFAISMDVNCYSRNLRGVANPIAKDSLVSMDLFFNDTTDPKYSIIRVKFPSSVVTKGFDGSISRRTPSSSGMNDYVQVYDKNGNVISGSGISAVGNSLRVILGGSIFSGTSVDSYGNLHVEERDAKFNKVIFRQENTKNLGTYYAKDGQITGKVTHSFTNDNKLLKIQASFPGEEGYCGGYHSPLALFFAKNPAGFKANNVVNFKLKKGFNKYYWVEKNNSAFFLALDVNKDGKINDGSELFGESKDYKNGFNHLAKYDKNKDGKINKKDAIFNKLLLWNDKNGNGKSEKNELSSLNKKKVYEVSLKYSLENEIRFGNKATLREQADFRYKDAKGNSKTGIVYDIWFAPAAALLSSINN